MTRYFDLWEYLFIDNAHRKQIMKPELTTIVENQLRRARKLAVDIKSLQDELDERLYEIEGISISGTDKQSVSGIINHIDVLLPDYVPHF